MGKSTDHPEVKPGDSNAICSFDAVADDNSRILVLGSIPGRESLRAGQYYAHPRNAFWPIMGAIAGAAPALDYAARIAAIRAARIALWDVLAACERSGSLDADIDDATLVVNDFPRFLACRPNITHVFFNGAKAESCYRRHVLPALPAGNRVFLRLPSTSPAHASLTREAKLAIWQAAFAAVPGFRLPP